MNRYTIAMHLVNLAPIIIVIMIWAHMAYTGVAFLLIKDMNHDYKQVGNETVTVHNVPRSIMVKNNDNRTIAIYGDIYVCRSMVMLGETPILENCQSANGTRLEPGQEKILYVNSSNITIVYYEPWIKDSLSHLLSFTIVGSIFVLFVMILIYRYTLREGIGFIRDAKLLLLYAYTLSIISMLCYTLFIERFLGTPHMVTNIALVSSIIILALVITVLKKTPSCYHVRESG